MPRIVILVRKIRERKGLSIRQLAKRSGVSHTEIQRIEDGEVSPSLDTMVLLADALGVDIFKTFFDSKRGRQQ